MSKFIYLSQIGVKVADVQGLVDIAHISFILENGTGEYPSVIVLNNNRQFRSTKYLNEIRDVIAAALRKED